MKKIVIAIFTSAILSVVAFSHNASALPLNDVLDACSQWSSTLDRANLTCYRTHQSGVVSCEAAGGSAINGSSSGVTCQWKRADLIPTVRSEASTICTYIWGGTWTASEASCYSASTNFYNYGSCSDWGGEITATGSHGETTCTFTTLVPGYDPTNPGGGDDDGDGDGDDDGDSESGIVPLADVDEGMCASILPDSWCKDENGIGNVISLVITLLTGAVVIAGIIGIILVGVMWMSARDNEQQVAKAKKRILEIVLGIVAWVLLAFLMNLIIPKSPDQIEDNIGGEVDVYIPPSTPSTPGTPSTPTDPTTPTDPSTPTDPTSWNRLCGPDPSAAIAEKYGTSTTVYKNNFGRTFYTYKQGDAKWGALPAGLNSEGVQGTMSSRGCYRTSIAEMFNSFGMTDFTPANLSTESSQVDISSAVSSNPDALNYLTYSVYDSQSVWKSKIIETMKAGGGVILIIQKKDGVDNEFTSSMHKMPIVDYNESNGRVYIANTTSQKSGWYDLDHIVTSDAVGLQQIVTFLPKDSNLKCN